MHLNKIFYLTVPFKRQKGDVDISRSLVEWDKFGIAKEEGYKYQANKEKNVRKQ